jgi:ribose/xylose/arabinose/galactoside ABC-type transport system permease subunit
MELFVITFLYCCGMANMYLLLNYSVEPYNFDGLRWFLMVSFWIVPIVLWFMVFVALVAKAWLRSLRF